VLLHGWREWGEDLVQELDGMWAFALYDRPGERLFLSRDRFGEKPLYWSQRHGTFVFASELQALVRHPSVDRSLDPLALRKYFAYGYVPAPYALHAGTHKLPAGCNLALDLRDAGVRVSRWWSLELDADPGLRERPLESLCEELREKLERAVARRLIADVPVGVFLSGGIDSSAIALFAARHQKLGDLRTFSIGFEEPSFDESRFATRVAKEVGSDHSGVTVTSARLRRLLPEIADRLDEPMADASLLPTHLLCGVARREVTVALGGDGGDELFAGYDPFRALRAAKHYARWVPRPVHQALSLLAGRLPASHGYMSTTFRVQRSLAGLGHPARLWNPVWLAPLRPAELGELLAEPIDPELLYSEAIEAWERGRDRNAVDRTMQFFTDLYLQNDVLAKVDRASMLHSLEVRAPFLDRELVDFVRKIPWDLKLHRGETKFLLKRALSSLLPDEILHRSKQGFGVPVGAWLRAGAAPFDSWPVPFERQPAVEGGGEAARRFRAERLAEHRSGRGDHRLYLYADWLLGRWLARPGADW
jgi:asparagine synthase (glutamine-hydrolysing)